MLNQLNTTTKRELDTRYLVMQGSKTVTGNPITITDAEAMNAESVVVELEPKQDLHGYDKPWVGGAGKNLLPMTVDGIKAINTDGTWNGNTYTYLGISIGILTDGENVVGLRANGAATGPIYFRTANKFKFEANVSYAVNGMVSNDGSAFLVVNDGVSVTSTEGQIQTFAEEREEYLYFVISDGYTVVNFDVYPMIRLATVSDATFEPYSNICPISGYDETSVAIKDTAENPTVTDTYTLQFGDTVYGAEVDFVSGVATVTHGYIAEYAGETLPSTWISDRDVYASGTTPTTGAQVVYELATPYTIQLTPTQIQMLENTNNISTDGTNIQLKYQPNNIIGECKAYTDEKCAKVLPKPPTSNGTYNLVCTVSSGVPTLSWKSTT